MGQELSVIDDRQYDGKVMASLPPQYRQFVIELMDLGVTKEAAKQAAEAVGFHPYSGYRLLRDKRIIAAINEEAETKFAAGALLGIKTLIEIASDEQHKDRYKAAKDLAAINGFSPEQKITVKHIAPDPKKQIEEIKAWAKEMDLPISKLLPGIDIAEGEFVEIQREDNT